MFPQSILLNPRCIGRKFSLCTAAAVNVVKQPELEFMVDGRRSWQPPIQGHALFAGGKEYTCFANLNSVEWGVHDLRIEQVGPGVLQAGFILYVSFPCFGR